MTEETIVRVATKVIAVFGAVVIVPFAIMLAHHILRQLVRAVRPLARRRLRRLEDVDYREVLVAGRMLASTRESKSAEEEVCDQLAAGAELSSLERRLLIAPLHRDACVVWAGMVSRTFLPAVIGDGVGRSVPLRLESDEGSCELRIARPSAPAVLLPHAKQEFAEADAPEEVVSALRRALPEYRPVGPTNMFREVRVRPGGDCVFAGTPRRIERAADGMLVMDFDHASVYPGTLARVRSQLAIRAAILIALVAVGCGGPPALVVWMALQVLGIELF